MKKTLTFFITFVLLSMVTFVCFYNYFSSTENQVLVKETILFGDNISAEGISINTKLDYINHMTWDIDFSPGVYIENTTENLVDTTSEYMFSTERLGLSYIVPSATINIEDIAYKGYEFSSDEFEDLMKKVADDTKNGETKKEAVDLRTFYMTIPYAITSAEAYYNDEFYSFWITQNKTNAYDITDVFNMDAPIDYGEGLITVTKDDMGNILEHTFFINSLDTFTSFHTVGAMTDEYIYTTFANNISYSHYTKNNFIHDSNPDYISIIPSDLKIYKIPYKTDKTKNATQNILDWTVHTNAYLEVNNMTILYEIDDDKDVSVLELVSNHDGTKLFLFSEESEVIYMTVVDTNSGEEIQKIMIRDKAEQNINSIKVGTNFIFVLFENNDFVLLEEVDGNFNLKLTDNLLELESVTKNIDIDHISVDYDGQRLAIVFYEQDTYGFENFLLVYDENGLDFAAKYTNSLTNRKQEEWYNNLGIFGSNPLSVRIIGNRN